MLASSSKTVEVFSPVTLSVWTLAPRHGRRIRACLEGNLTGGDARPWEFGHLMTGGDAHPTLIGVGVSPVTGVWNSTVEGFFMLNRIFTELTGLRPFEHPLRVHAKS